MNTTTQTESGRSADASELEREGDKLRADLDQTMDALGRKLAPGEVMDRTMRYVQENGGELLHRVGSAARENPVPWLIAAAGLTWVAASMVRRGNTDGNMRYSQASMTRGTSASTDSGHHAMDSARHAMGTAREKMAHSASALKSRAGHAQNQFNTLVQEQPLMVGALAVAVGAVLGAALPMTEYENRTVGPVHDRALAKAADVGRAQYEKVRDKLSAESSSDPTSDEEMRGAPGSMAREGGAGNGDFGRGRQA